MPDFITSLYKFILTFDFYPIQELPFWLKFAQKNSKKLKKKLKNS